MELSKWSYLDGVIQMKIANKFCENCKQKTPHAEDMVMDRESATVWHCLYCGKETRPTDDTSFGVRRS